MPKKINSRKKGAAGERELVHKLREMFNLDASTTYRGCQHSGGPDSPDVKSEEMDPIWHIECKRVNRLNIWNAMLQSIRDCGGDSVPVVIHRADRQEWLLTLRLDDIIVLASKISSFVDNKNQAMKGDNNETTCNKE